MWTNVRKRPRKRFACKPWIYWIFSSFCGFWRRLKNGALAERVGFEPTLRFHVNRISSAAHSTTLPPLQAPFGERYSPPEVEGAIPSGVAVGTQAPVAHSFAAFSPSWGRVRVHPRAAQKVARSDEKGRCFVSPVAGFRAGSGRPVGSEGRSPVRKGGDPSGWPREGRRRQFRDQAETRLRPCAGR